MMVSSVIIVWNTIENGLLKALHDYSGIYHVVFEWILQQKPNENKIEKHLLDFIITLVGLLCSLIVIRIIKKTTNTDWINL